MIGVSVCTWHHIVLWLVWVYLVSICFMIGVNVCVLGTMFYDWCGCVSVLVNVWVYLAPCFLIGVNVWVYLVPCCFVIGVNVWVSVLGTMLFYDWCECASECTWHCVLWLVCMCEWEYLTPWHIPYAITLTLGSKVVLNIALEGLKCLAGERLGLVLHL